MTFLGWLKRHGYRESTAAKSAREVELARELLEQQKPVPPRLRPALCRYAAFRDEDPDVVDRGFLGDLRGLGVRSVVPRTGAPKRRRRPHLSFELGDWVKLTSELSTDRTACGCCLWVMCTTGLRIGDVLRIERSELQRGLKSGVLQLERKGGAYVEVPARGARDAWERLLEGMTTYRCPGMVSSWVVRGGTPEAGGAAYQRVNRYLRELGKRLELSGPVHLHRIRRTVAVQALHLTGDMKDVQQLLAHASGKSTELYVDELRWNNVAQLQERLASLRGGPQ